MLISSKKLLCSSYTLLFFSAFMFCVLANEDNALPVNSEPDAPSISELYYKTAMSEAQDEVIETTKKVEEMIEEGELYEAKRKVMELKATLRLEAADYRLLDFVERKLDEALGEDLERVIEEVEQELKEIDLLTDYRKQKKVQAELNRRTSRVLTEQADVELYQNNNPEKAAELTREAIALDPENDRAAELLLEAEVELGKERAILTQEADLLSSQARAMVQARRQEYNAIKRRAIQHQEKGEYAKAAETWARARTHANVLSVYVDMEDELELVERQYEETKEQARILQEEEQEELARRREEEARIAMEREMREQEEMEAEQEAQRLNQAWSYVRRGRYDEARKIVEEMLLLDSTNEGALVLQDIITRREHDDLMRREVQRREREDLALIRRAYERATAPGDEISYPDRQIWERIMNREEVQYPTEDVVRPQEELDVEEKLKQRVGLDFERHRDLTEITDYISDITDISIIVNSRAFEDSERPPRIRARFTASVRDALDHVVREGSRPGYALGWQIVGENVRIDNPEALKDYKLRIYDIRDLLVSVDDTIADDVGNGGGGGGWFDDDNGGNDVDLRLRSPVPSIRLAHRARALEQLIKSVIEPNRWRTRDHENDNDEPEEDDWWGQAFGGSAGNDRGNEGPYIHFREENPGDFLIVQTPEVHERIENLLRELRKAIHIQVHVETRFVEVTETFLEEVGVNWENLDLTPDFEPGDSGPQMSADIGTGIPVFPDQTENRGMRFDFGIFEGVEMEAFLKAVRMSEHSRVTHTPTITLMNTQRGQLWVRTSRFFITEYDVEDDHYTPEREEFFDGIMLDIRPIVSSCRRYVYLELKPMIDKIIAVDRTTQTFTITEEITPDNGDQTIERSIPVEVEIENPRRLVQEFFNTVGVPDQGLLVVGGLGESEERTVETGVPVLSKLPFAKRLFGSEGSRREDKTLLILVRPRIIMFQEEEALAF